jgi:sRNA-binding carbon storage regulator CsrA
MDKENKNTVVLEVNGVVIRVIVKEINHIGSVRLGFDAPSQVKIVREELL